MDFEQKVFKDKKFSDILEEIYNNSKKKNKEVTDIVTKITSMLSNIGDVMALSQLLSGYVSLGLQADDHLIKMAAIVQKALGAISKGEDPSEILSAKDKEMLLQEIQNVEKESEIKTKVKKKR